MAPLTKAQLAAKQQQARSVSANGSVKSGSNQSASKVQQKNHSDDDNDSVHTPVVQSRANSRPVSPTRGAPVYTKQSSLRAAKHDTDEEERVYAVNRDLTSMANAVGDAKFAEFRNIFTEKYQAGNPIIAMYLAINEMCQKHCGEPDERCEKVLKSELMRLAIGKAHVTSDDMTLFTQFVASLNDGKKPTEKPFHGKGFDASFFMSAKDYLQELLVSGSIAGIQISDKGMRANVSGKSNGAWKSINTFVTDLIGGKEYISEENLAKHLSSTRKATREAKAILATINPTPVTDEIMSLHRNKTLPTVLQAAMVYRALQDNGKLEGKVGSFYYSVDVKTSLGSILKDLAAVNKYITVEAGFVKLPFTKVSTLNGALFAPDLVGDKVQRTIVDSREGAKILALAIAFRYESKMNSEIKKATPKA